MKMGGNKNKFQTSGVRGSIEIQIVITVLTIFTSLFFNSLRHCLKYTLVLKLILLFTNLNVIINWRRWGSRHMIIKAYPESKAMAPESIYNFQSFTGLSSGKPPVGCKAREWLNN